MLFLVGALGAATSRAELADGLYAALETSMGGITCLLDYAEAPLTCANFVGLAEGTQHWIDSNGSIQTNSLYSGCIFHRVIDDFMIQGGDPLGTGTGGPGYKFPDEFSTNLTHHSAGILSMANSGEDSNGSQFFITLAPTAWLDNVHSVFGEVVSGMNVVSNIGAVAVDANDRPESNVVIQAVLILRVGADAQSFDPSVQPLPEVGALQLDIEANATGIVAKAESGSQCENLIYQSTNLSSWASYDSDYQSIASGDWRVSLPSGDVLGFFRGARIFYPQKVTFFNDLSGRVFTFTQGSDTLVFRPLEGARGTCSIVGNDDVITYWEDWTSGPYPGIAVFGTTKYSYFKFVQRVDGSCEGYQYRQNALGYWQWEGLDEWVVGEQDATPE
ncbi:MAG: peptidylprolyl isomerase [Pontiellaceae bacterium]|nr:peptidylprolyl isomerase [Pontiellaceae bacterium]MBN2783361.1 peptidylprolyl isomerase [Pontiellaceae bacterium]